MAAPKITVACASRRAERLAFMLEALAEQTLPAAEFEVVIARDATAPADPDPPDGLRVTFLRTGEATPPSVRRNIAWRAGSAPFVAFTDDDCRPAPGWLEAVLAAAAPATVLQGRTAPDPAEAHLLHGLARSQQIDALDPWFQTCNMAYPRELLEAIDGFDERYGFGAEDSDLGLRAEAAGAEVRFEPEMLVWHSVNTPSLAGALRGAWEWEGMPRFVARHPGQRSMMFARVFWKPAHAWLLLGLLGSVLARGHAGRFAAWAPYLAYHANPAHLRRPGKLARWLAYMPQKAAVDAVEVAACARESARSGTLLL